MAKFRAMKALQKFAATHAVIHNHLNLDRHLNRRDISKQNFLSSWPIGVSLQPEHFRF